MSALAAEVSLSDGRVLGTFRGTTYTLTLTDAQHLHADLTAEVTR